MTWARYRSYMKAKLRIRNLKVTQQVKYTLFKISALFVFKMVYMFGALFYLKAVKWHFNLYHFATL